MFDAENTIKLFADQYYEKIFYFSLKKTGNRTEAEDLTSDIILDIITALRKGVIPEYFSAYVWKVARNRFFKWAEKKSNSRKYLDANNFDDFDNFEFDLHDEKSDIEKNYIKKEDINILRREISLISKDYREILVSFYIDDKKISQIAKEFNLPEGTIKTKLFKSRKILTEGMKMAREFGIKSYKPEDVSFIKSGLDGTDGSPWSKLKTKLAKNILLEAYHNPSTIEELSLELGVAAPYMEEAVDELVEATLMKKTDKNKYQTDFRIYNAEEQKEEENKHLKVKDEYFELSKEIISIVEKEGNKDLLGGTQTFEELKWLYLLDLSDGIYCHVERKIPVERVKPAESFTPLSGYTKRPYGGYWDICGYEEFTHCEYNTFVGYNGNGDKNNIIICAYDFHCYDWGQRDTNWSFTPERTKIIEKLLDGKIDESDKNAVEDILNLGAFELKDGKYICKMAIAKRYETLLSQSVSEDVYKNKILPICEKLDKLRAGLWVRPYVFSTAIKTGYLKIPEDFGRSMAGICVWR